MFCSPLPGRVWTGYARRTWLASWRPGRSIVDIRPVEQRSRDGHLDGAVVIDRNVLEWRLDPTCPHHLPQITDANQRIVVVCNEGYGSSLAAATLHRIGLHRSTDLMGGFQAWRAYADRAV